MKWCLVAVAFVATLVCSSLAEEEGNLREKRSAPGYPEPHRGGYAPQREQGGYKRQEARGYEKHEYTSYQKKTTSCYQCAYSPPKTYYDKKVKVESVKYGKQYGTKDQGGYGNNDEGSYGTKQGGYTKKTYIPVPYTINGGWDKCLGPFDHYQAQRFGIDVWDCHSNCYVRKDPNGNIFRGCFKGEYGVDPYKTGCHYQAGAVYCFCEGDKCNNGAAPH